MAEESSETTGGDGKPSGGDPIQGPKKKKKKGGPEWKICKGCLFYSSRLRSNGRGPPCLGTERPFSRVPASMPEKYKVVATREGNLSYFKYACVGYSLFLHGDDSSTKEQGKPTLLPVCGGYELLLGKKTTPPTQVPTRKHQKDFKEDLYFVRSRTTSREMAGEMARDTFIGRFARSAEAVASGVARNLLKVGSFIKDNLDKRPK